jgi:hypothetical protein
MPPLYRDQRVSMHLMIIIISSSIQPLGRFWQEPEPSHSTGMALTRCILGKFLGVVCHCSPLPDDYSTKKTQKYFKQFQSLTMIR